MLAAQPQAKDTTERFRRPGPWTAVPSHLARDRAFMRLSLQARYLHVIAWLYANRERTDGVLGAADFRNVSAEAQLSELEASAAVAELVDAGLWRSGYELVDFLKWNLDAEEIKSRAAENRTRVDAYRKRTSKPYVNPMHERARQLLEKATAPDLKRVSPDPFPESEHREDTELKNTQVSTRVPNALPVWGLGEVRDEPTSELISAASFHAHAGYDL